jgi:5-methylcytosine-specific restriction endonuclease McrBC regulatory subunit McrC
MGMILFGLKEGLDVSIYAKPEFNYSQMDEILFGLKEGLDVSKYAKPDLPYYHMREMRNAMFDEKYLLPKCTKNAVSRVSAFD